MRRIVLFCFLCITLSMLAKDVIVIQRTGGKAYAIKVNDVDSIYFGDENIVPDSLFNWTTTIYDTITIHDTITKSVVSADNWHYNIENALVDSYMNNVDYSGYENDYSFTKVTEYSNTATDYVKHRPAGVVLCWDMASSGQQILLSYQKDFTTCEDTINIADNITSYIVDNLYPGRKYYYRIVANDNILKEGHFWTLGQVRLIDLPSVCNVRDLGGWKTEEGKTVKYGRIYRGAELNRPETLTHVENHQISSADSTYMVDKLKIRLEIDLRDNRDMGLNDTIKTNDKNFSELGSIVEYYNQQVHYYPEYMKHSGYRQRWRNCVSKLVKYLKEAKNCYFHCTWGADRTGTMAMLILGTLGVPQADLDKEYELTCFSVTRTRSNSESNYWKDNLAYINSLPGDTLKDKFAKYLKDCGVTQQEIDDLRSIMLE